MARRAKESGSADLTERVGAWNAKQFRTQKRPNTSVGSNRIGRIREICRANIGLVFLPLEYRPITMLKKSIPNALTLMNLGSGVLAIIAAFQETWSLTFLFFVLCLVLDFLDGGVARALKVQSELGKQLDSLSDVVSFGVLPALVMFLYMIPYYPDWNIGRVFSEGRLEEFLPLVAVLVPMSTALRLGRFNLMESSSYFLGLPSPANALLLMSIPMILRSDKSPEALLAFLANPYTLAAICLFSTFLLNAPFRLFTLKFKGGSFQDNIVPILFLIAALVLLLTLGYLGIPLIIMLYIGMSLLGVNKKKA